jgi:hypothetical protein
MMGWAATNHLAEIEFADGKTTMIYTHVLKRGGRGVTSPLDRV